MLQGVHFCDDETSRMQTVQQLSEAWALKYCRLCISLARKHLKMKTVHHFTKVRTPKCCRVFISTWIGFDHAKMMLPSHRK